MFFPALLAAITVTVTPPPFATLKVIGSVRSTPVCTALRKNIAPAVAALLENDATISQSPPIFPSMYKELIINQSPIAWCCTCRAWTILLDHSLPVWRKWLLH